jgi:Protein of unknown function (DUF541)
MCKCWLSILLFAVAPVFGQLESNTVTVSATSSIQAQPDEVVFYVTVTSPLTSTLDQILAALSGLGITSANLNGIGNYDPKTLQWNFTLAMPLTNLTYTIGSLTKLEQTITQNNSGLALTFSIGGTQVSSQLQQSQSCSTPDLVADATAQAQKLAAAAGLVLGRILKLTNAPSLPSFGVPGVFAELSAVPVSRFVVGYFPGTVPQSGNCSLIVQFRLLP